MVLTYPDSKVFVANMGPIWVLSAPGGPHVGPMKIVIWVVFLEYSDLSIRIVAYALSKMSKIMQVVTSKLKFEWQYLNVDTMALQVCPPLPLNYWTII